jgi:hypothetical protein
MTDWLNLWLSARNDEDREAITPCLSTFDLLRIVEMQRPEWELEKQEKKMTDLGITSGARAGDADRTKYVDHLAKSVSTGHLTAEEFDVRSSRALTAKTIRDLDALVPDLPSINQKPKPSRFAEMTREWNWAAVAWLGAMVASLCTAVCTPIGVISAAGGTGNLGPVLPVVIGMAIIIGVIGTIVSLISFIIEID